MINVAAIRMQQFGVQFYQASLTASDIDKLVRFEVLSYGDGAQPAARSGKPKPGMPQPSKVNWDFLERRIASSDKAYQRQIIRKKIDELVQYYEQCRQARDLPSIPGAVIISCDEKLSFSASDEPCFDIGGRASPFVCLTLTSMSWSGRRHRIWDAECNGSSPRTQETSTTGTRDEEISSTAGSTRSE
jgi:hypothetical protein